MPPASRKTAFRCPPKPALEKRPLMNRLAARSLAGLFKVLANDTRLRLLHCLIREGEVPVSRLSKNLGMKPQAVSNQLQRLAGLDIVQPERRGVSIYYRVLDPCVRELLDRGLCLDEDRGRKP